MALFVPNRTFTVQPPKSAVQTILSGDGWSYTVPFAVVHVQDIEQLIQCESSGKNISSPDSGDIYSDGILRYHRGPKNTMQSSTWQLFSEASGIQGSPIVPADAIRMTDWAISNGLISHWTCARILHLTA